MKKANNIKRFLKKYKYIIIVNLIIFITYVAIQSVPELFGMDDTLANAYIFYPNNTIMDNIRHIFDRATNWNMRIGEILFFITGCFPRYVFFFFNGIRCVLFFNILFVFIYGKNSKNLFLKKEYLITILSSYVLTLTLFPAFSETFIWMAGTYNHVFDLIVILLVGLHFRLLLDDVDIFKNRKVLKILFLILSFVAGFTLEHVTPCLILYETIILNYLFFKKKAVFKEFIKENIFTMISVVLTAVGLLLMYITTNIRIVFFQVQDWYDRSKSDMLTSIISNYKFLFILTIVVFVIAIIVTKRKKELLKNLLHPLFLILLGITSLLIVYVTPAYYVLRTTLFFYFTILTLLIYLINVIFKNKFGTIAIFANIIIILFMTYRLIYFYKDFNKFNDFRKEYIISQYISGEKTLICPAYDNKLNYLFATRLSSYEQMYCDNSYISYLLDADSIYSKLINIKDLNR